jgi:hypothetical protein
MLLSGEVAAVAVAIAACLCRRTAEALRMAAQPNADSAHVEHQLTSDCSSKTSTAKAAAAVRGKISQLEGWQNQSVERLGADGCSHLAEPRALQSSA